MTTRRRPRAKRPIESYDHRGKERLNNPPVGKHYVLNGYNASKRISSKAVAHRLI